MNNSVTHRLHSKVYLIQCILGNIITNECFVLLIKLFFLLLSTVICKARSLAGDFQLGAKIKSVTQVSGRFGLSMHTQPSCLRARVTFCHFFFFDYDFSLLAMLRISLFTGKSVVLFLVYPSVLAFHDTKLEITWLLFSLRKDLIQSIICI